MLIKNFSGKIFLCCLFWSRKPCLQNRGYKTVMLIARLNCKCNPEVQIDKILQLCVFITCYLIILTFNSTAMITARNSEITRLKDVAAVPPFTFRSKNNSPGCVLLTQIKIKIFQIVCGKSPRKI